MWSSRNTTSPALSDAASYPSPKNASRTQAQHKAFWFWDELHHTSAPRRRAKKCLGLTMDRVLQSICIDLIFLTGSFWK